MAVPLAVPASGRSGARVVRRETRALPRAGLVGRWPELVPVTATLAAWTYLVLVTPDHSSHLGWAAAGHSAAARGAGQLADLTAMTVAMTGLLAVPAARTAVFASPWWRRRRAVTLFMAGFVFTWTAVVLGLHAVGVLLSRLTEGPAAGGALLALCALAQLHPRRSLRAGECDRPMRIRPHGRSGDLDCARFGVVSAARCARLCTLPMLAMLSLPAGLWLTVALAALALGERLSWRRWPVCTALLYSALAVAALA